MTKNWQSIAPSIKVPKVDSHAAVVIGDKMFIYGGYDSDCAEELIDIYVFDLIEHKWEQFYQGGKTNEPVGRSDLAMI